MASIREDLDSFHRFASERLAGGASAMSLDELLMAWHDAQSRDEINQAIRRGLSDVDAGRHRPADESLESIRQRFGFRDA
ncbi:MAG: hypothetical protein WD845_08615 [Pirellulales bacterium]